jgi:D-alanine-D-alanine ligase
MSQFESNFGKVAVLMGGASAEREVSLMSGQGVLQALRDKGVDAHAFDPAQRDLGELKRDGFARCFIACMAALVKTARCRARWSCWASPTPGRA